ncbi:MAG: SAM-dependent chlorinase/fluorinase [Coriobacteriia bacterium]
MIPIICFTSDFGLADGWAGVCHATIYRTCPQAKVVDLSHEVPPFDIRKGAFVAASGAWQLPKAIHLVVVDPGVGGGRRDLVIVTGAGVRLVGPDNGVLMLATWRSGGVAEAYEIDPRKLRPRPPLPTFHARDVLAPAAAVLASGVDPESLGAPVDPATLVPAPFSAVRREGDALVTEVIDIDRFGSVRLGVAEEDLEDGFVGRTVQMSLGHQVLEVPIRATFADVEVGEPVAVVDSSGWLTLALREDSAAERYGIEAGMPASVQIS